MRRSKPHPELQAIERRILLSSYVFSSLGNFGINGTGANPESTLVADASGNLFGTAAKGGADGVGTVFEVASGSNVIVPLASFDGADGSQPAGGLALDAAADVYGTTYRGGANNDGTVFEVARGSNAITTLAVFEGANGSSPLGGVALDGSGNLYGATFNGGASNHGTVFEIPSGTRALTTLASFAGPDRISGGVTLDAAGDLFGTAGTVASTSFGVVFELARGSNTIATFAAFDKTTGSEPLGGITRDASGNLYGTTYRGGAFNAGTVFEIASGSNVITTLASFDLANGGNLVAAPAVDAQGNVYGDSYEGGLGGGTVFEIARGSQTATMLAAFNGTTGSDPLAGVTLDASGNILGLTSRGGAGDDGTLFEIAHGTKALTALASFDGTNGVFPNSALVPDSSGNVYGTTETGGADDQGSVFEIATGTHTVTTLASFNGTNGAHPFGGLTADASGDLYGTTPGGGPGGIGLGTVFEIAHGSNAITTVASFGASSGGIPHGGVTLDASGNLYGTTEGNYTFRDGSVFEIPKGSNTITTLAAFDGYNGSAPVGDLAVDRSGNLYGTTESGGSSQAGTVFKIARGSSTITTLAVFNTANGALPGTGVILDPAGNLYGTTEEGGADGNGTVFEIPTGSAVLTTVASFDSAHGLSPGALIRDPAGNLFGTTIGGGTGREGTVFEIQQGSNAIATLMSFNGTNGARPDAITLDTLGNLFGTTVIGGPGNAGTVFELAANSAVTLAQTRGGNPAVTHEPLTFTATLSGGVPDGQTITLLDASNNDAVVATGTIIGGSASLTIPRDTLSAGTHHLIAVYGGDLTHAASTSKPLILTILSPFFRPHRTP